MATVLAPHDASYAGDELDRMLGPRLVSVSRAGHVVNRRAIRAVMTIRKLTSGPMPPDHMEKIVAAALAFSRERNASRPVLAKALPQSVQSTWADQGRALAYADRVVRAGPASRPLVSIVNAAVRHGRPA